MIRGTWHQLQRFYRHDRNWCSDYTGKWALLTSIQVWGADDTRIKEMLRALPIRDRWLIERRTGVWLGTTYPQGFADIAPEIGVSISQARNRYRKAIRMLRSRFGLRQPRVRRGLYSPKLRFRVLLEDQFRCRLCGATAADGVRLEVDHIKPRSQGGSNKRDNLWTLCFSCNRGKRTKDLSDLNVSAAGYLYR